MWVYDFDQEPDDMAESQEHGTTTEQGRNVNIFYLFQVDNQYCSNGQVLWDIY